MAGRGFALEYPAVVAVELRGTLPEWVQSKDVILELLRRHGVRGGVGRVFEFTGEGVATLSVTDRGTIAPGRSANGCSPARPPLSPSPPAATRNTQPRGCNSSESRLTAPPSLTTRWTRRVSSPGERTRSA
jgi:hypothetical protein